MIAQAVRKIRLTYPAAAMVLGMISIMLVLPRIDTQPLTGIDSAMYVSLGRSLSTGQGYVSAWIAGHPAHVKYPPFFPLLLAPLISRVGINTGALKLYVTVMSALALAITAQVLARRQPLIAALAAVAAAFSVLTQQYASSVLSEMPYAFLVASVFLLLEDGQGSVRTAGWRIPASGVVLALAVMTRLVGVALLMAVAGRYSFGTVRRQCSLRTIRFLLAPAAVCLAGWVFYVASQAEAGQPRNWVSLLTSYDWHTLSGLAGAGEIWLRNVYGLFLYAIPQSITGWQMPYANIWQLMLSMLTLGGLLWCSRRHRTLLEWYAWCTLSALSVCPGTQVMGTGFLVPLIPLLLYYCIFGVWQLSSMLGPPKARQFVALGGISVLLFSNLMSGVDAAYQAHRRLPERIRWNDGFQDLVIWLKTNTSRDDILVTDPAAAAAVYVYSGRSSIRMSHPDVDEGGLTRQQLEDMLAERRVSYGVVFHGRFWSKSSEMLAAVLADGFPVCFTNGSVSVYDMR